MDQDQLSNNSDEPVSGESSNRSALSSYLRAIRNQETAGTMNPTLSKKSIETMNSSLSKKSSFSSSSSSSSPVRAQVSNSVKDIQGMFSSLKPSPSRIEGRERRFQFERERDETLEEGADYRKTFVHAKFSTRIGNKFSMEEEGRDRSLDNGSNLRRFSSATHVMTTGSSHNVSNLFENRTNASGVSENRNQPSSLSENRTHATSSFESRTNGSGFSENRTNASGMFENRTHTLGMLENRSNFVSDRHPRRPNYHKSPNLPFGGQSRSVLRLETSEDDTEDDACSILSKSSNSIENVAICSNSTVNSAVSSTPSSGVSAPAPLAPRSNNVKETLNILNNKEVNNGGSNSSSSAPSTQGSRNNSEDMGTPRKYSSGENRLAPVSKTPPEVTEKPEVSKKLRQLDGYVGFANMPNQVYRKAVKRGFEFTLMVVGESGLGKSTLINSMFLTDIYSPACPGPSARIKKTVAVETNKVLLKESGVNLTLTIVDTPGFGDAIDNSKCWDPVINFVESRYEEFLDAETRVNRVPLPDTRVHACLYFIAPSGHGLKPLDAEFMRRLHDKVNIIPVIAKADTLTPEEIVYFKDQIMRQISQANIKIYDFPDESSFVFEEKDKKEIRNLKSRVPFAVVGSNTLIEPASGDGKRIRGRKYPWGVVDIENMEHCDFVPLRNMLIRTYLQDLKEVTNNVLYENFRCRKLAGVAGTTMDKIPNKNPLATIEEERREHQAKMTKMEKEMEEVFERKVREKKNKLNDSEIDLEKRHRESKEKLDSQKRELEAQRAAFLEEKNAWESMNGVTIDELKRLSMESLDGGKKKKSGALSGVSFRMGR